MIRMEQFDLFVMEANEEIEVYDPRVDAFAAGNF